MIRLPTITATALLAIALLAACSDGPRRPAEASPPPALPATVTPAGPVDAVAKTRETVTIGWVGDTTPGSRYGLPPQHGRALFAKVRTQLQAPDIMAGNLEGTFGTGGRSKEGSGTDRVSFRAPPDYAPALSWAGFDLMSVANNHSHDYLEAGMTATQRALTSAGVAYTGLPRQITVVERNGVRVAFIAVAPYPWCQSLTDIRSTAALVGEARKSADVVIVLMHAGAEGADKTHTPQGKERAYGERRGAPRAFGHAMIDAGASAVLGSGPHVVRGIERYKGRIIAYSLGNFAGWDNFKVSGTSGLSGLLTVEVDKQGGVRDARWLSLKLDDSGVPSVDPEAASAALVRQLSAEDFADPWPFRIDAGPVFVE